MAAGKYNMVVEQGETFQRVFKIKSSTTGDMRDLTGWTAAMQVRKSYAAPTALLTLTSGNGKLVVVIGNPDYNLKLDIPATDTAGVTPGDYVYDIELTLGAYVEKLLKGKFSVNAEVTKV